MSLLAVAGVLVSGVAGAQALALSDSTVANTSNGQPVTTYFTASGPSSTGPGTVSMLTTPGSYTFVDTFTTGLTEPIYNGPSSNPANSTGMVFIDDFSFTVGSSTADSVTTTVNLGQVLGISGLYTRLYSAAGNGPSPVLGTPNGTVFDSSTTTIVVGGATETIDTISTGALAAGTYVLQVEGTGTGTSGGSYSGVLNLTPVPLPAGWLLLLSAAAPLLLFARAQSPR
jgi:hypothetical protein